MQKFFTAFYMLIAVLVFTACGGGSDEPGIGQKPSSLADGVVGNWLLASSDNQEWAVYEFKQSGQMTSEWFENNVLASGVGIYDTTEETSSLSATINDGRGHYIYLDWIVKKIQTYQIDIDVYGGNDGNQFMGSNSLYRILGTQEVEYGTAVEPDYRKFAGTKECSGFTSLDKSVVTVNSSGKIQPVKAGSTYVVFNTPAGHACIKVVVLDKVMTFSENIIGTWVTEIKGFIWERDVFGPDGYFYSQWSREIIYPTSDESAQGTYTTDDANKTISVSAKTPYDQRLNPEYRVTEIDRFSFNTEIYVNGTKSGEYYYQRVLASIKIAPKESEQPDYLSLVGSSQISGFSSHEEKVAAVDKTTGRITGVSKGITYIDVKTNNGIGVIEVEVQ